MKYLCLILFMFLIGCSGGSSGGVGSSNNDSPPGDTPPVDIPPEPETGTITLTGITATLDEIDFLQYSYINVQLTNTYSTQQTITYGYYVDDPTRGIYDRLWYVDLDISPGINNIQITWNHNAYYYSSAGPPFKIVTFGATYDGNEYYVEVQNNMEVGGAG